MHCCAKCLLKKKLADDDAKQRTPVVPDIKNDIQLFGSPVSININNNVGEGITMESPYIASFQPGINTSVFHPPQA